MRHEENNLCHFLDKNGETILPDFSSYRIVGIKSPLIFLVGFQKNEADLMCSSMITSVCTYACFGNPPKSFTTNNSESSNHLPKQKADYKRNEWPIFNKLLQDLCERQQHECAKAVFGEGEFELVDKYKHLEVPHSMWI